MTKFLLHNSRLSNFRSPQGPLTTGQSLRLKLLASRDYESACAIARLWVSGEQILIPMTRQTVKGETHFAADAIMPDEPGLVWYFFIINMPDGDTLFYGGESGRGDIYALGPPAYQITVYDAGFTTPRWFRESIMYQIFPDRFNRGGLDDKGLQYHRAMGRKPRVHEDWYEQPDYLPEQGSPYYMPNDFYLGDLEGIRQKLGYLKSLGVGVVYLNPVFEACSNHRYDTADYRRIDPILGSNEDLARLAKEFEANGIRLMLDGVFSHTGADSVYFNKYERFASPGAYNSELSPYRSWYDFTPEKKPGYRCWWGFPELPEVIEQAASYLNFIMDGEDSLLSHWKAHGVTSWRLDVADELPDAFIVRMRERLKALDPEGVLLGEVWEDASNKEAYGELRTYVLGKALDSVMNYPFQNAVLNFFLGHIDAHTLNIRLQTQRERYPKPFYYAVMNLLSSHDCVRALTVLGGAPGRDSLSREAQAEYSLSEDMLHMARQRLIAATALQMAMPGVPSIYYGDEAGLTGMADPFNRAAYPWGREDTELVSAFSAYAVQRKKSAALKAGYCRMGAVSLDVFAVLRFTWQGRDAFSNEAVDDAALCLVNRSRHPAYVRFSIAILNEGPDAEKCPGLKGMWIESRTGGRISLNSRDEFELILPPMSGRVYAKEHMTEVKDRA